MPQIFDVTANENARYKRNELELYLLPARNVRIYFQTGSPLVVVIV